MGLDTCKGKCADPLNPNAPCQCNTACVGFGDCCPDYEEECSPTQNPITDAELEALGEELWVLEGPNNNGGYVTVNLGGPRLLTVDPRAYEKETVALMADLWDTYTPDVTVSDQYSLQTLAKLNAFIDAVMSTPVFQRGVAVLASKGIVLNRAKLWDMWFELYSRPASNPNRGSSGFEHVFLGELNNGVTGFHNWLYYDREEPTNLTYTSCTKYADYGPKGGLLQLSFRWHGFNKPITSMFVGTSPEFELTVFSVCWLTRSGGSNCPQSYFGGNKAKITTYTIGSSNQHVGSAYADPTINDNCPRPDHDAWQ